MSTGEGVPADLLEILARARRPMVLTGAGISAESGVPTFREAGTGLWARYDPMELATPEAFARDPGLVWRWYQWRRNLVSRVAPNAGHAALVNLAQAKPGMVLVTQNVDGLHQRAGATGVVEFHGNLFSNHCRACGHRETATDLGSETPPACPRCASLMGPGVVWFGEMIPSSALDAADRAARHCDIFFSVGTSALVAPASGLAALARSGGATLVEINPSETDLTRYADFALAGPAGRLLPLLVDGLMGGRHGQGD